MVAGVISDASLLTMEAQQALLKTLEEPPTTAILFLGISQKNMLLPTVLSRLESVVLKEKYTVLAPNRSIDEALIENLLNASSGQRLSMLSLPCKTKEESRVFYRMLYIFFEKNLPVLLLPTQPKFQQFLPDL